MKNFVFLITAIIASLAVETARAQAPDDSLRTDIWGNSGASLRYYDDVETCSNLYYQSPMGTFSNGGGCPYMSAFVAWQKDGLACCAVCGGPCLTEEGKLKADIAKVVESEVRSLRSVFSDERSYSWGYQGTTNRSPNSGRTVSAAARLDACVGSGNQDNYGTSGNSCRTMCDDSSKNGYCTAYGTNNGTSGIYAAVCKDRCDCVWGDYQCDYL